MKRLLTLAEMILDIAKNRRGLGAEPSGGDEPPGDTPARVFSAATAELARELEGEGFRYTRSQNLLHRASAEFGHRIAFQSSHDNKRGRRVALWIHATVRSDLVTTWKASQGIPGDAGFFAGGQIGNLVEPPRWFDWDLASVATRDALVQDALQAIRDVALPFFARFSSKASALETLGSCPILGVEPEQAIELALALDRKDLADQVLGRFFKQRPELLPEFLRFVEDPTSRPKFANSASRLAVIAAAHELENPRP
ncbi:MAG TPA: hypothetical protein VG940_06435 [Gemmatimonadales bacterium]|nr:hypothetical protein [Gemmatimonadales bacterium]